MLQRARKLGSWANDPPYASGAEQRSAQLVAHPLCLSSIHARQGMTMNVSCSRPVHEGDSASQLCSRRKRAASSLRLDVKQVLHWRHDHNNMDAVLEAACRRESSCRKNAFQLGVLIHLWCFSETPVQCTQCTPVGAASMQLDARRKEGVN